MNRMIVALIALLFVALGLFVSINVAPSEQGLLLDQIEVILEGKSTSSFTRITTERVSMKEEVALLCRSFPHEEPKDNLHAEKFLHVYVNNAGLEVMRTGIGIYPEGSIIVKQKFSRASGDNTELFTVMRKMKNGYDSEHGNWEYSVLSGDGKKIFSQGRNESCILCHAKYESTDYVTRTYIEH